MSDLGNAFLRFSPAPILDAGYCAEHEDEFGVPKCRRSEFGRRASP